MAYFVEQCMKNMHIVGPQHRRGVSVKRCQEPGGWSLEKHCFVDSDCVMSMHSHMHEHDLAAATFIHCTRTQDIVRYCTCESKHSHSPCSIYQSKSWDEATSHWNPTKPSQCSKVLAFSPIGENFRRRVGKHSWQSCVVLNDLVCWMCCLDPLGVASRFECSPPWWIAAPSIGHILRTKSFRRIVTLKQCPCPLRSFAQRGADRFFTLPPASR